ncbi:unnamed protein product [Polarella glacialis]|uniref:Uncharacterized protein n=1 Tax=Polarella glacialis TaxID=89957 RepID=A0A813ELP6_POLGL|nr:unnamed protein product [Polarella glacialis]
MMRRIATANAVETTCTHLDMCFVPHGTTPAEDQDFDLESEPLPGRTDIWARMVLETRKSPEPPRRERGDSESQSSGTAYSTRRLMRRPGNKRTALDATMLQKRSNTGSSHVPDPRMVPWQERRHVSSIAEEVNRKLWADKAALRIKDQELQAALAQEEINEARKRLEMVQESLGDVKPCAFDSAGNQLTVDFPNPDRLPNLQANLQYELARIHGKSAHTSAAGDSSSASSATGDAAPLSPSTARRGRREAVSQQDLSKTMRLPTSPSRERVHKFTDSFVRLDDIQPPIAETIALQPGVVLECRGRTTVGQSSPVRGEPMAWKDYVAQAEGWHPFVHGAKKKIGLASTAAGREGDTSSPSQQGVPTSPLVGRSDSVYSLSQPPVSPPARSGQQSLAWGEMVSPSAAASTMKNGLSVGASLAAATKDGRGYVLPESLPVRPVSAATGPPPASAPAEPAPGVLASRAAAYANAAFGALRSQPRQPRQKVALLGGCYGAVQAVPQPPLGATMGHGLMRTQTTDNSKGDFFYPHEKKAPPRQACHEQPRQGNWRPMKRASSAGSLRPRSACSGCLLAEYCCCFCCCRCCCCWWWWCWWCWWWWWCWCWCWWCWLLLMLLLLLVLLLLLLSLLSLLSLLLWLLLLLLLLL